MQSAAPRPFSWPRLSIHCLNLVTAACAPVLQGPPSGPGSGVNEDASQPGDASRLNVHFAFGPDRLSFFSVVSTIGTPIEITAQELRVEAFFPSDAATQKAWTGATE
jgi:hypothetical protein